MLLRYNSEILETFISIKDENEALNFLRRVFSVSIYLKVYMPLSNVENQKIFKLVEIIIEHGIQTHNYMIFEIMSDYVSRVFLGESNMEYLFESDYIIWCTRTYKKILESNETYKSRHLLRNISPRFYNNQDLLWFYQNYTLIEHISPEEMSVRHDNIKNELFIFENGWFTKFIFSVDPGLVLSVTVYMYGQSGMTIENDVVEDAISEYFSKIKK